MKKLICLTILILLSGCSSTTPTGKSTSKQPATSTVTSHVKPTKKTVPKATLSTLVGHAFVQVDNRKRPSGSLPQPAATILKPYPTKAASLKVPIREFLPLSLH